MNQLNVRRLALILFLFASFKLFAQSSRVSYLKIKEDQDFLNVRGEGTDRYYTNGTALLWYYSKFKKPNLFEEILLSFGPDTAKVYSYGVTHLMYTPSDISSKQIVRGDRPYAAVLYLSHAVRSTDKHYGTSIESTVDAGVLGPWAHGRELQTWVHHLIGDMIPKGWDNQIQNDLVFNYSIQADQRLLRIDKKLDFIGEMKTNFGTLTMDASMGAMLRYGKLPDYFATTPFVQPGSAIHYYLYTKFLFTGVINNSTLQGGFFNKEHSPYVLIADDVNHGIVNIEYGLVIGTPRFVVSLSQKATSPEFEGAAPMQVGNISLFIHLN